MHDPERLELNTISRLIELGDYIIPLTLAAVADLGVADCLAGGPKHIEELARETGTHPASLQTALAGLASRGIFVEQQPDTFGLTPIAEYLRSDHPHSMRDWLRLQPPDVAAWAQIEHTMRTGSPAFEQVHGISFWEYLAAHPQDSARFDGSQQAISRLEIPFFTLAYKWNDVRVVVDVGGGNGAFLAGLLKHNPALHGVLFDLPHAVANAPALFAAAGLTDRCRIVGGSFLEDSIPEGEDLYLMKRILWGHGDVEALRLLRNVRAAMRPDSRLLIVEPMRSQGRINGSDVAKIMDLKLLALRGSGSRDPQQVQKLLRDAGLGIGRTVPAMIISIIEVHVLQ
jgi:hypothetical protein